MTILLAVLALLLLPSVASAADAQESIFEEDQHLLQRGPDTRNQALNDIAALGADTLRLVVQWRWIAPAPESRRRPKGFRAANPAAYQADNWDALDDVVRGAQARGLGLLLSPSGPIPDWASRCRSTRNRRTCRPHAQSFGAFVTALGRRYSGTYADENQGGAVLPRVERWSFWNEPNQPGWLTPQYESKGGRRIAIAAHLYRRLVISGAAGLRRTGHSRDQALLGETAPIGRTSGTLARRPIPPSDFWRELFCLDSRGRRYSGAASSARGCRRFRRLAVNGIAHHPYTRGGSQPPRARSGPNEITVSSSARLKRVLRQGERAGRIRRNLPIYYTEFGYQSNPPDRLFGVPLDQQATYINESDYLAFRDSRVKGVSQYKLFDETSLASFQSGLRFVDGGVKPAYDAYRLPVWVVARSNAMRVYGQVRPAADGSRELVDVQHAADGGGFQTVQTVEVTSPKGHFLVDVPKADGGRWRLRWSPSAGGPALTSRDAVAARG
jgi:hypothetical protein